MGAVAEKDYTRRMKSQDSKAERIDRLLTTCAFFAVLIGVLQWAAGHYVRALLAGLVFLVIVPWLGKKWIKTRQLNAADDVSSAAKIVLFVLPPWAVEQFGQGHWVLFGSSFIAGALLQASIPPRTYKLPLILGLATAAAIIIPVVARLAGWQ